MSTERIDFISAYCDRWCERCAFTSRCSAFACDVAAAMCGDLADGIELAVGTPHPVDGEAPDPPASWLECLNTEMSAEELAEYDRQKEARDARIDGAPLTAMAWTYTRQSTQWLDEHRDGIVAGADPVLREAVEVVSWDAYLIGAKLHRALDGRDRSRHGEDLDDHPVQTDWNGSAKVALISIERSEDAWRMIAAATGDAAAGEMADQALEMRRVVNEEFPRAMSFVRPGFDEPG